MKILVCGSRDWLSRAAIHRALAKYEHHVPSSVQIIHGDCRGADQFAADAADVYGYTVRAFPADWEMHGKAAGPRRNRQMLDEKPDVVIAFQRNSSRGAQDTIDEARRRGIPVEVHTCR